MEISIREAKRQTSIFVEEIVFSQQKRPFLQLNLFCFSQFNELLVSIVLLR